MSILQADRIKGGVPFTVVLGALFLSLTGMYAVEPAVSLVIGSLTEKKEGAKPSDSGDLSSPFGVDFDSRGNMIIVELGGGRVHRLSPDGKFSTISGDGSKSYRGDDGPASEATFDGMHNVAIGKDDAIYIADSWNHCIRRIVPKTGMISTIAGTGEAGFGGDGGPATEAKFNFVMCITLNATSDTIHVADLKNLRIRAVDLRRGTVSTVAGNGKKGVPKDGALAIESPLVDPRAVASDSKGNLYVLERSGNALRVVRPDGRIYTVAGSGKRGPKDGPALQAELGSPKHICVDDSDNIFIADDANAAIRKYDPRAKLLTTVLGRGKSQPPIYLKRPHGVCFEKRKLYVVDTGNNRILRMDAP
ncbi:MAG: hypothetical protein ACKVJX_15010 [Verrucomicrobiia bacterium]|jgi:sugar lactone lactonase YvrE